MNNLDLKYKNWLIGSRPRSASNGMKKGFSLIEMIVYIAVLSMVFGVFTGIVLAVNSSYAKIGVVRSLDIAGITSVERMTRTIRASASIDAANSTLGTSPGVLALLGVDASGAPSNAVFQVSNQNIQIKVNGTVQGTLLPAGVTVSSLVFRSINSGKSTAVKIEMQLSGVSGKASRVENYYSTIILRGSYK